MKLLTLNHITGDELLSSLLAIESIPIAASSFSDPESPLPLSPVPVIGGLSRGSERGSIISKLRSQGRGQQVRPFGLIAYFSRDEGAQVPFLPAVGLDVNQDAYLF